LKETFGNTLSIFRELRGVWGVDVEVGVRGIGEGVILAGGTNTNGGVAVDAFLVSTSRPLGWVTNLVGEAKGSCGPSSETEEQENSISNTSIKKPGFFIQSCLQNT
jgi:hypothetical protein|tara:strand:- start:9492 stop:9809 length:318 start_codon:yes stop_codon:yes gene_type:complete